MSDRNIPSNQQCTHFEQVGIGVVQTAVAKPFDCPWCQIERLTADRDEWKGRADQLRDELESRGETSEDSAFVIHFDDRDRPIEVYTGNGAERAARQRFEGLLSNWNCQLFRMIDDGKRPALKSSGEPT